VRRPALLLAALLALAACQGARAAKSDLVTELALVAATPAEVLPGTVLTVEAQGVLAEGLADYGYQLSDDTGRLLDQGPATRVDDGRLSVRPSDGFVAAARGDARRIALTIARTVRADGSLSQASLPLTLTVTTNLDPSFEPADAGVHYLYDTLGLAGHGFLQPGEGDTVAVIDGDYTFSGLPGVRRVHGLAVPLDVVDRDRADLLLTVDLFGVRPGRFSGTLRVENHAGDDVRAAPAAAVSIEVAASRIDGVQPSTVRRGQVLRVLGAGFVPTDFALEATTLVALDGTFAPKRGPVEEWTGTHRLIVVPDAYPAPGEIDWVLRVTRGPKGTLVGLGAQAGTFSGSAVPVLVNGIDWIEGAPVDVGFTVGQPLQVVLVKYLPGFAESLADFGLQAAEARVHAAILQRCAATYEGINIAFVEKRPTDLVDYSVIELGGQDPNRAGLLGLDNTEGKDTGNLRFNDVLGGMNAGSEEAGYYAYGGVFLDSFFAFSPTWPESKGSELAAPLFDEVFADFVPALGGTAATDDEVAGQGSRAAKLDEAIVVLGNLVGDTVAHEVGHSLGLANIDGEYHSLGDNPGWIMDAGPARSFLERSGLGPDGPEHFSPDDRAYLLSILPLD
jgi:hypothetical protein